jgi:hypothetical protein
MVSQSQSPRGGYYLREVKSKRGVGPGSKALGEEEEEGEEESHLMIVQRYVQLAFQGEEDESFNHSRYSRWRPCRLIGHF